MYLSTHIVLHFVFDQAFVNTTLSCLGVAAKSFTIISTCEKEWTIQVVIVRLKSEHVNYVKRGASS